MGSGGSESFSIEHFSGAGRSAPPPRPLPGRVACKNDGNRFEQRALSSRIFPECGSMVTSPTSPVGVAVLLILADVQHLKRPVLGQMPRSCHGGADERAVVHI